MENFRHPSYFLNSKKYSQNGGNDCLPRYQSPDYGALDQRLQMEAMILMAVARKDLEEHLRTQWPRLFRPT